MTNKVLMMVNSYAPDDPRVIFGAISLTRMGYEVFLIGAARQKNGEIPVHHNIEGVKIVITPMVAARSVGGLFKALWRWIRADLGETTLSSPHIRTSLLSMLFFNLWILRLGIGRSFKVVHCHDLSPLPAAWILAKLKRAGLIYDAHEDAVTMYEGRKSAMVARMERFLIRRVDTVISAGHRLIPALKERGAKKVMLVGNWKRLADYKIDPARLQAERERLGIVPGDFVVTYIGTMDPTRAIVPLLEAVEQADGVKLVIGGRGILQNEVEAAAKRCDRILWLGWVDMMDVPLYTHLADVIYHCRAVEEYKAKNYIAPAANKVFEAFAAGKPIMASRGINEVGDILEETGAGYLIEDVSPESIREAFQKLHDDPQIRESLSKNALAARDAYNWGVAEARLAEIYGELMK